MQVAHLNYISKSDLASINDSTNMAVRDVTLKSSSCRSICFSLTVDFENMHAQGYFEEV